LIIGTSAGRRKGVGIGAGAWRRRQCDRNAESAVGPPFERERSVVRLGDALDNREAEADACVVGADALRAALTIALCTGFDARATMPGAS
jgi:hypothetical protein